MILDWTPDLPARYYPRALARELGEAWFREEIRQRVRDGWRAATGSAVEPTRHHGGFTVTVTTGASGTLVTSAAPAVGTIKRWRQP